MSPIPESFDPSQPLADAETEQEVSEEAARELRKRFIVKDYEEKHAPAPESGAEKCGHKMRLLGKGICERPKGHSGPHHSSNAPDED